MIPPLIFCCTVGAIDDLCGEPDLYRRGELLTFAPLRVALSLTTNRVE